jgi:hypothetical protein
MTEQNKTLSTQALNKITKGLYAGEGYSSKTLDAFHKAKAEFDKARRAVLAEVEQVRGKIADDEENVRASRAFKKLEGEARWEAVEKFDNAGSELSNTLNLVGYSYEGYDVLSEAWQSSSMHC